MPKLLSKFFTKLRKKANEPREGYFVLFFAVVITMLMLPVLSGLLADTVETRSQVADYYQAETARDQGESVLFNKLESLSREHGLGYFETDTVDLEDGSAITYTYSAASVITTPTKYTAEQLNVPNVETECYEWLNENEDGRLNLVPCAENSELNRLPNGTTPANHFYTVPALGTGDVGGANCQLGQLIEDYYPEADDGSARELVDPLDHPCSWNKLSLGQNVAIPLYVNTSESPDTFEVFQPNALTLRVRFRCADFAKNFCPAEERIYITHEDVNDDLVTRPEPREDLTPRVLDWAIEGQEIVLPDNRGDFDTTSGKAQSNREITIQRFFQNETFNSSFIYLSSQNLFTVDFLSPQIFALAISDAFDGDASEELFLDFYDSDGLLNSPETNSIGPLTIHTVSEDAPVLNLGFLNALFEGCETDTFDCRSISEIEYQLVSNVPLGNHKFVTTGFSERADSTYALMKAEKSGPEVVSIPGTVFGS